MRLFGKPERRFALDKDAATRIFQGEFNKALDALDDEREQAAIPSYEFGNLDTFLDVHEEVYRYLADRRRSPPSAPPIAIAAGSGGPIAEMTAVGRET